MQSAIVFRTDATASLGIGHIKRCITLAERLRGFGTPVFLCRWLPGVIEQELKSSGFAVVRIGSSAIASDTNPIDVVGWIKKNWRQDALQCIDKLSNLGKVKLLVVDYYGLGAQWESVMRTVVEKLLVIDDLANRKHDTDILLDQTYNRNIADYVDLVPSRALILCGSRYALVSESFHRLRRDAEIRRQGVKSVSRLLVSLGGTDVRNFSSVVLDAISTLPFRRELHVDVVLTSSAPHIDHLAAKVAALDYDAKLHIDIADMASMTLKADLAIGASGSSTWERAVLGLPTITLVTANNQRTVAAMLQEAGAICLVDTDETLSAAKIGAAILSLWNNPVALQRMSSAAFGLCDGFGAMRVAEVISARGCKDAISSGDELQISLRRVTEEDIDTLFMWQNEPEIRRYSRNPAAPGPWEHRDWFYGMLRDISRQLFIVESDGVPAGMVRLDAVGKGSKFEVSILISEPFQGFGLGRRALDAVKDINDVQELRAHVRPENTASIRLFGRSGFIKECDDWYAWRRGSPSRLFVQRRARNS